ncbi:hypothetical protein CYMTET_20338 [Cymbomonas tetramitiformis]|uniref:Uncharacterized protein n=1 Tax=Cymbomonas tetramitiformis TaxID=36881 RepID=A0AAE0G490_9CHLO|nr:hypothetical protein CYMTET_20338 [Cymbomonas tetramitiformis]
MCSTRARLAWHSCLMLFSPKLRNEHAIAKVELQRDLHMVDIHRLERLASHFDDRIKRAMSSNLRASALDHLKSQKRNDVKLKQHRAMLAACEQMLDRLQTSQEMCVTVDALRQASSVAKCSVEELDGLAVQIGDVADGINNLHDAATEVEAGLTGLNPADSVDDLKAELDAYLRGDQTSNNPKDAVSLPVSHQPMLTAPASEVFVLENSSDIDMPVVPRKIALLNS